MWPHVAQKQALSETAAKTVLSDNGLAPMLHAARANHGVSSCSTCAYAPAVLHAAAFCRLAATSAF